MRSLGKLLVLIGLWLAGSLPAQAAWHRAESQNFIVYSEGSEAELRRNVAELEDYAQLLRTLMAVETPPSNKLQIYLVRGSSELQRVRRLPREAAGVYISGIDGIAAVADMNARLGSPMAVLFHEYAHHFMRQYQGQAYPAWYTEGFAEYMMTARFTDGTIEFGHVDEVRARTLSNTARWLPMEDILFGEPTSGTIGQYYAQSWLLTHYLLNDPERLQRFRAYLFALARAQEPRQAFQASFGITPDQLQRQLASYVFGRGLTAMRMPRRDRAGASDIRIAAMPASADDLLLLEAAMQVGLRDDGETLQRIRREAARHNDAFAQRILARAEALYGDGETAERLLDGLLATSPDDAELLYLRGMRYVSAARNADGEARASLYRQARPWFSRAHRIDANHFQTLFRYVQTLSVEPNFVSENNAEILLLAHTLAPQVGEVRLAAAQMLVGIGDFELAEGLLMPLVGTAHESALTEPARALLASAKARSSAGTSVTIG